MKYLIIFACILYLTSCSPHRSQKIIDYRNVATEKYGNNVRYLYNASKTAVICVFAEKSSISHPIQSLNYFIFDIKNNRILHEAEVAGGSIKWIDDQRIEIKSKPEVITGNESDDRRSYILDITSLSSDAEDI